MHADPREQISELEVQIEELAGALERCRKTAMASKAAMAFGGILLAATILGVVTFDPMAMVAGLAALLGGVVVFGSNTSTANQLSESMRNAEAHASRADRPARYPPGGRHLRKSPSGRISLNRPARVRAHGALGSQQMSKDGHQRQRRSRPLLVQLAHALLDELARALWSHRVFGSRWGTGSAGGRGSAGLLRFFRVSSNRSFGLWCPVRYRVLGHR